MEQALIVFTTLPDESIAMALADTLVERKLAACVHIMPKILSVYRWEGKVEHAHEVSLQIKTTQGCYADLELAIKNAHPYQVPEIIGLPIVEGLPAYLDWVKQQTKKDLNV